MKTVLTENWISDGTKYLFSKEESRLCRKAKTFSIVTKRSQLRAQPSASCTRSSQHRATWQLTWSCMAETRLGLQGLGQEGEEQWSQLQITHLCHAHVVHSEGQSRSWCSGTACSQCIQPSKQCAGGFCLAFTLR